MKKHSKYTFKIVLCAIVSLSFLNSRAQVKGLYDDFFGIYILHDATLKTNLINYATANGFNYLLLYDVNGNVLDYTLYTGSTLSGDQNLLKDFIADAKNAISGLQIGVSGGALKPLSTVQSKYFDNVKWFNDLVQSNERIDVIHLEDEYWGLSTDQARESQYAQYISQLTNMWSIKTNSTHPLIVETYLGYLNNIMNKPEATQVADIDPITDRILFIVNEYFLW